LTLQSGRRRPRAYQIEANAAPKEKCGDTREEVDAAANKENPGRRKGFPFVPAEAGAAST